jgi:hypothetical protein|tara:strand:+ start:731 stop:1369 length:639 start_codon:yes stop_codon:yes gene_type:complete
MGRGNHTGYNGVGDNGKDHRISGDISELYFKKKWIEFVLNISNKAEHMLWDVDPYTLWTPSLDRGADAILDSTRAKIQIKRFTTPKSDHMVKNKQNPYRLDLRRKRLSGHDNYSKWDFDILIAHDWEGVTNNGVECLRWCPMERLLDKTGLQTKGSISMRKLDLLTDMSVLLDPYLTQFMVKTDDGPEIQHPPKLETTPIKLVDSLEEINGR